MERERDKGGGRDMLKLMCMLHGIHVVARRQNKLIH